MSKNRNAEGLTPEQDLAFDNLTIKIVEHYTGEPHSVVEQMVLPIARQQVLDLGEN